MDKRSREGNPDVLLIELYTAIPTFSARPEGDPREIAQRHIAAAEERGERNGYLRGLTTALVIVRSGQPGSGASAQWRSIDRSGALQEADDYICAVMKEFSGP